MSVTQPDTSKANVRPASAMQLICYCLANLGFGMFFAFNNGTLPLWLQQYTKNDSLINLMSSSHSFEGAIIQPLTGSFSDRLRTRWGKRRPIIFLAVPLSCLFLLLTPIAASLPVPMRLTSIVGCIVLFTLTFNIAYDPYQALMADVTPASNRGRVMSFWYLLNAVGQVSILFIAHIPLSYKFGILACMMLVTTVVALIMTPEKSSLNADIPQTRKRDELLSAFQGLATLKQARFYMLMFFCYGAGTEAVMPNITRFVKSITHCSNHSAELSLMVLLLATAICSLPCGWIADKIGSKLMLLISLGFICTAALSALVVSTLPQVYFVMTLAGVGTACQNASAYPLLTRIVPAKEIGFYTGLYSAALSITTPLALYFTGILTHAVGYRIVFLICAVCSILASVFLGQINPQKAVDEIAERERLT